ncbi:MAG: NAD(P)-dependent oxidoreductase [Gammaproteobacteria bacterium]|nr:NAD(P)-dependent oxidoreductase [Gammaproteobacteria bacterium]
MQSQDSLKDRIAAFRLSEQEYAFNFKDSVPPLTPVQAYIEASRCYYCYDAPCITACPTGIDIPGFIHRIFQKNVTGAAKAILDANPLGGMCARVCPTDILCEGACVRNTNEDKPVEIGALQRFATDAFLNSGKAYTDTVFQPQESTGFKVAIVGSGPAGLSCAHKLALKGHQIDLFESHPKLGGLNEYGLATYKTTEQFAQKEIDWLVSSKNIKVFLHTSIGKDVSLQQLLADYDAVFLGLGLGGVNSLTLLPPPGVLNAIDFISQLRQAVHPKTVKIGTQVVVIGGGMTAIDAAVQSKLLGADKVTIVYRKGKEQMPASPYEKSWAQKNDVHFKFWAAPSEFVCENNLLTGLRVIDTQNPSTQLSTNSQFIPADMILLAIGQNMLTSALGESIALDSGRIKVDVNGRTSHPKIWAGGDCCAGKLDLTVSAVQDGKLAAENIDKFLGQKL